MAVPSGIGPVLPPSGGGGAAATPSIAYVSHGATASTARPSSTGIVVWRGSVAPTNGQAGDEWEDTASGFVKRRVGNRWRRNDSLLPNEIANCKAWWPMDEAPQADGAAVASIIDATGGGVDAVQATASQKPVYRTNYQNGLGAIVCDGTDDALVAAVGAIAQPLTVIAALRGAGQRYLAGTDDGLRFGFDIGGSSPNIYGGSGINSAIGVAGSVPGAAKVVASIANGVNSALYQHDIHLTTGDAGAAGIPAGGVQIGRSTGQAWLGGILEVALFTRALRPEEILAVSRYLRAKWGC